MPDHAPTKGFRLGRIAGARVVLQPSALVMVALLAYMFASRSGEVTATTLLVGGGLAVALFVSIFLHEVSHALSAKAFKRDVHEIVVTLWGGHTSFGKPETSPKVSGVTAAAGPLSNLLIALICHGLSTAQVASGTLAMFITWLGWSNLILGVFNLLPGIPMDGGRVLEAIIWGITGNRHRGTVVAAWGGRVVAIALIGFVFVDSLRRGESPDLFSLMWAFLIASILWPAATAALRYSQVADRRESTVVRTLMDKAIAVPHTLTVAEARERALSAGATEVVVLSVDGAPAGHFPTLLTEQVPPHLRDATGLAAVTMPLPRGAHVDAALNGEDLVRSLREWWGRAEVWVVNEGDDVVGVVKLQTVLDRLK